MVLYNGYTNDQLKAGELTNPVFISGDFTKYLVAKFQVNNSYDINSVLRIAKVPATSIISESKVFNSAIPGLATANLGIYNPLIKNNGEALAEDIFLDAASFTAARTHATGALDGLRNLPTDDIGKRTYELAGETSANNAGSYDIGLKLTSAPSANPAATGQYIIISILFAQG